MIFAQALAVTIVWYIAAFTLLYFLVRDDGNGTSGPPRNMGIKGDEP